MYNINLKLIKCKSHNNDVIILKTMGDPIFNGIGMGSRDHGN